MVFGEVVTLDMPELCEFSSLDSRQKRLLWAHKEVDLALHPVIDLALQGDAEKYYQALVLTSLDPFSESASPCPKPSIFLFFTLWTGLTEVVQVLQ